MISLVTLFGGRPHLLEAYFAGLDNLDYDKMELELIWVSNSDDAVFRRTLETEFEARRHDYDRATLHFVDDLPPSQCANRDNFKEGEREHAKVIAALYNRALSLVSGKMMFSVEDDVFMPHYALKTLLSHMRDDQVAVSTGLLFSRHDDRALWTWELQQVNRITSDPAGMATMSGVSKAPAQIRSDWIGIPLRKPWGVREVGLTTLGCTLIRTEMLKAVGGFKPQHDSSLTLRGCDMVMGLDFELRGWKRIADFNVNCLHFDSQGVPH